MSIKIINQDAVTALRTLPSESVQMVCTSPPYFQLRDYQTGRWDGGSPDCDHEQARIRTRFDYDISEKQASSAGTDVKRYQHECPCGATRIDQQIGLEQTPAEFIAKLVAVFDEVRRVLRADGTCWVNLGDSYAGSGKGPTGHNGIGDQEQRQGFTGVSSKSTLKGYTAGSQLKQPILGGGASVAGIPAKNLLLIPERFAIAMQDAGWWVRSRIAWCKTSAMPESVRDRPTSAWEHLWLFTKSRTYYYDAEAVRQPHVDPKVKDGVFVGSGGKNREGYHPSHQGRVALGGITQGSVTTHRDYNPAGANLRNYWLLGPEPSTLEHYAAYPTELVKRCILAGSKRGDMVLDPFLGSGTTAMVADRLQRDAIGIELSPVYVKLAEQRLQRDCGPMFADSIEVAG